MSRRTGPRHGQVVVIFGLALLVIVLMVGLVVDGGTAFLERRGGQNNADLAALSGTKVVADAYVESTGATRGSVYAAIAQSMSDNRCSSGAGTPCTWTARFVGAGQVDLGAVSAGDGASIAGSSPAILGVRVDVTRRPRTFFLGLIGQGSWRVDTLAAAIASRPTAAPTGQLLPIALKKPAEPFQEGQVYDLTEGKPAPGGFHWLSWTGSNDPRALATSLCTPNNPAFSFPRTFPSDPGKSNSSDVRSCLDRWIQSKSTVLIPTYLKDPDDGDHNASYSIVGLAAFVITSRDQPAVDDIRAFFVGTYPYPNTPAGNGAQPPRKDDSVYYVGLVR
jgi:hypothetical protein